MSAAPEPGEALPGPPGAAEATRVVVERYLAALNAHDPDSIAALVSDDFFNEHTSSLGHSLVGRSAYRERLPVFLAQFGGLSYEVEGLVCADDEAAAAYTMRCVWRAPEGGEFPVSIRGVFWFRVRGGLVAHRRDYFDGAEFLRQVGLTPAT